MPEATDTLPKPSSRLDAVRRIKPDELRKAFAQGEAKLPARQETKSSADLVRKEKETWKKFFGVDVDVAQPPQELFEVLARAEEVGLTNLVPHYLPAVRFGKNDQYPGLKTPLGESFWNLVVNGRLAFKAPETEGSWVLVDETEKISGTSEFNYKDDALGEIIEEVRISRQVDVNFGKKRTMLTYMEIMNAVFPQIAMRLRVDPLHIRIPRAIEYNLLANAHHPEWLKSGFATEWLSDSVHTTDQLVAGHISPNGTHYVTEMHKDEKLRDIGFRPMIVFPEKAGGWRDLIKR